MGHIVDQHCAGPAFARSQPIFRPVSPSLVRRVWARVSWGQDIRALLPIDLQSHQPFHRARGMCRCGSSRPGGEQAGRGYPGSDHAFDKLAPGHARGPDRFERFKKGRIHGNSVWGGPEALLTVAAHSPESGYNTT